MALRGTAGVLAGLGLMAIPGVGPIVAAGWLVSTLAGAAAGGATGGVIGALTQAGVGKDEADIYAESLRRGGAVVSARVADSDAARLQAVLDSSAVRVTDRAAMYRKAGLDDIRSECDPLHAGPGAQGAWPLLRAKCLKWKGRSATGGFSAIGPGISITLAAR